KVILVRVETNPDDIHGMIHAQGVLTSRGGMTSHAAVVARGMGKPCVAGCGALEIDYAAQTVKVGATMLRAGDWLSLDGSTGEVFVGQLPTVDPELNDDFHTVMEWADARRSVGVRANADTPHDAAVARRFGAEGIGLCRTEHMFFEGDRIDAVRAMIVADTHEARLAALAQLEPLQEEDFVGIFKAMDGFPVTIRTLDPPLHEFLPHDGAEVRLLARKMQVDADTLRQKIESLREANPMLGFRGCRLGIIYPEITEMQVRAIMAAAARCQAEGVVVKPEIMIPLVSGVEELRLQAALVRRVAAEVQERTGQRVEYMVGTMIELPRAALTADRVAEEAEFFSFGTNDLTQTTLGLSRDDSGRFLPMYVDELKLIKADPFQTIDQEGVGQLVEMGVERGRRTKPDLKIGVCGEHGGDPESVEFFVRTGLDYVSCSPYRVPIARLAAAQAALGQLARDK
ncbi:MAG TPA: putative PEP-binding protein, partial [Herpetosiphonaceae bacterium]